MKHKTTRKALAIIVVLVLALSATTWAGELGDRIFDMSDPAGNVTITEPGGSAVGGFAEDTSGRSLESASRPPSNLARQDYQNVYDRAQALLDIGADFRATEIQIQPPPDCWERPETCEYGSVIEDTLENYRNYNGGELFYRFCANYDEVDEQGYCPGADQSQWPNPNADIRSQLIRARELFAFLSLAEPVDTDIDVDGQDINVRVIGREGVLEATREIANIHLIFGNEFLVDALDYRFSGDAVNADLILAQEIAQLEQALQQFTMAVDVLAHAFNADFGGPSGAYIGDYFTNREFELFGITSERMVMAIGEIANRHRQLGREDEALAIYAQAFTEQYVQALALAYKAAERDANFLNNGGWEMMTNLSQLGAQAQAIHDGINPFGFKDDYVPLQTYDDLRALMYGEGGFYTDADRDEQEARDAQREFDHNATNLNTELQHLRVTYGGQLFDLCGAEGQSDDYQSCGCDRDEEGELVNPDCDGGLMEQNYLAMATAADRIVLVYQRLQNVPEQIRIEEERAGRVIEITLEGAEVLAAIEYARGILNSYRVTEAQVDSSTGEWYVGADVRTTVSFSIGWPPTTWGGKVESSHSVFGGYRHSWSNTTSMTTVWDPAQEELGRLNGLRDVQQAATQAQIVGANSEAAIRNLLLQQAELMIEMDIAIGEYNRLAAEHNHLVETYRWRLNLRAKAQQNVRDSYLNNPAYRILRDTLTVEAARSHGEAAQFAYLTAKALEYEFLAPPPFINNIFKARTADDIDNFLIDLTQLYLALGGGTGARNRYPYRISIAQDLLGLSDENLDPDNSMTPTERAQLRYQLFQEFLQQHVISDTLKFPFTTSLLVQKEGGISIFSPNIWNNRIAGVGLPVGVPGTQGLFINILTWQLVDAGTPEVILTHGGHASYRTADREIVEYTPGNARLSGYVVPPVFENKTRTAVILSSVNDNGLGTPSSALFNLSVAASSWTLRIDPGSPFNAELDITQIEDIEILMDTTGIAVPGRAKEAQMDALRLQAEFDR